MAPPQLEGRASTSFSSPSREGAIGGFGAHALHALAENGLLDSALKVQSLVLLDIFIDQDSPAAMYAPARLDAKAIVGKASTALGQNPRAAREGDQTPEAPLCYPLKRLMALCVDGMQRIGQQLASRNRQLTQVPTRELAILF